MRTSQEVKMGRGSRYRKFGCSFFFRTGTGFDVSNGLGETGVLSWRVQPSNNHWSPHTSWVVINGPALTGPGGTLSPFFPSLAGGNAGCHFPSFTFSGGWENGEGFGQAHPGVRCGRLQGGLCRDVRSRRGSGPTLCRATPRRPPSIPRQHSGQARRKRRKKRRRDHQTRERPRQTTPRPPPPESARGDQTPSPGDAPRR